LLFFFFLLVLLLLLVLVMVLVLLLYIAVVVAQLGPPPISPFLALAAYVSGRLVVNYRGVAQCLH